MKTIKSHHERLARAVLFSYDPDPQYPTLSLKKRILTTITVALTFVYKISYRRARTWPSLKAECEREQRFLAYNPNPATHTLLLKYKGFIYKIPYRRALGLAAEGAREQMNLAYKQGAGAE